MQHVEFDEGVDCNAQFEVTNSTILEPHKLTDKNNQYEYI
jgi:hypothetical protein